MTNNTIFCGLALLVLGIYGYFNGQKEAADKAKTATEELRQTDKEAAEVQPEKVSPTALIPAAVGMLLLACAGAVIFKPELRKHVMHAAAVIALVGFLGGFMPVFRSGFDWSRSGVRSGILMSVVCAAFVYLCVQSFIEARKAREAGVAPSAV